MSTQSTTFPKVASREEPAWGAPWRVILSVIEWFGELGLFVANLARAAVTPPFEFRELLRQMDAVGSQSFPLVALAGAATGVVLALQTRDSLTRFGAKSLLPGSDWR